MDRLVVGGLILAALVIMSWRDLTRQSPEGVEAQESLPVTPKLKKSLVGPTLTFLYWRVYEEFSNAIRQRYPSLIVEGDNYPPPPHKAITAQVLSITKIALIVLVLTGQNPFPTLGLNTPSVLLWAQQNKLYACMMLFFIGNAIEGQLISTGAFEISFNDLPVWSKLENGRVPSPQELFQIIDSHMRMTSSSYTSPPSLH